MQMRLIWIPALLLVAATASVAPRPALAKSEKPAMAGGAAEPEELTRFRAAVPKLGLSTEQRQKVDRLIAETKASLKKLEAGTGTPEQKQAQLKALHMKARGSLDNILTVAQNEKLKKLMAPTAKGGHAPGKG